MRSATKHWLPSDFLVVVAAVVVFKHFLVRICCLSIAATAAAVVNAFHCRYFCDRRNCNRITSFRILV